MDRFDAFVSYSHAADGRLAPEVQRGLQRLAKRVFQRRALTVFRDETGLSTNPHLWGSIESALDASTWFILLASPEAARSEWVAREVATWIARKPLDHLLIVVTDGEIGFIAGAGVDRDVTTCLPEPLVAALDNEPRWLDLRWARTDTQLDLRNGRFRAAVADLAAPIHGVAKDDLEGEDVRQQRRARRLATTGIAAVAVLAVVSTIAAVVAVNRTNEARDQRNEATAQKQEAEAQRQQAEAARADAEASANVAVAKSLAAQAAAISPSDVDLGLLLGVEGYRRDPSLDTKTGLVTALDNARGIKTLVRSLPTGLLDVEISPDRATLYALTVSGDVWAIDTARWTMMSQPLLTGVEGPWALDVSAGGSRLAVAANNGVTVIDLPGGAPVATGLTGSTPASILLSPDGSRVAVGRLDTGTLQVIDLATGDLVFEAVSPGRAKWSAFLAGERIAVQGFDGVLRVYDLSGDGTTAIAENDKLPRGGSVVLSPDATKLIAGGLAGTAQIVDSTSLEPLSPVLSVRGSRTGDFFFNPDGTLVGMGSDDGSVRIFDVQTSAKLLELTGMTGAVYSEFTGAHTVISISSYDNAAVIWDLDHAVQLGTARQVGQSVPQVISIAGGSQVVMSVDGSVTLAPAAEPDAPTQSRTLGAIIFALDVNEQAGLIAAYAIEIDETTGDVLDSVVHMLRLTDLTDEATISFGNSTDWLDNIRLSPDGSLLAVGRGGSLAVYATADGAEVLAPTPVDTVPYGLALLVWNREGSRLQAGGQDGTLHTIDTTTWKEVGAHELAPDQSALRLGRLSPDRTHVIVPIESGYVYLVDATTGEPVGEPFVAAGTQLQNAVLVDGGSVLAAVSRDGTMRLWDVASRRPIGPPITGHSGEVDGLDVVSDNVAISSGAADGRVITWNLDPDGWADRACELAGRNLTMAEWDRYVGGDYRRTCEQWPEGE